MRLRFQYCTSALLERPFSNHKERAATVDTMRSSSRLFATVKSASKYLEANTPTGLTGLTTHPSPRPALIYTYRTTLSRLTQLPSSSVYRQSAEALTKQRLKIVEETIPEGFDAWVERVKKQIEASPAAYGKLIRPDGSFRYEGLGEEKPIPWDGDVTRKDSIQEGTNSLKEAERKARAAKEDVKEQERVDNEGELPTIDDLEIEPPLNREQYVLHQLLTPGTDVRAGSKRSRTRSPLALSKRSSQLQKVS